MKKSFWSKLAIGLSSLALLAGCSSNSGSDSNQSQSQNASKTIETLKIAFVPSRDPETIVTTTEPLKELLKKELAKEGYDVKNVDISVGTSFDAVGEALASGSADIGFLPGGTYVLYDKEVDVLLTATRDNLLKDSTNPKDWNDGKETGRGTEQATSYKGLIIAGPTEKGKELAAKINSGQELTWDELNSAKWGVLGTSSSSGYIYPTLWLQEKYGKGISDLQNVVQSDSYASSAARLASGQIDIMVGYADVRNDYAKKWTSDYGRSEDIFKETNVIGVTPDIYNDTISVSKSSPIVDDAFKEAFANAMMNIAKTDKGKDEDKGNKNTKQAKIIYYTFDINTEKLTENTKEVDEVSVGNIVKAMIENNMLQKGVEVNSAKVTEIDGVRTLVVDMNDKFINFNQGSTAESLTLRCFANSLVKTFKVEQVKLTVDGQNYSSGHIALKDGEYLKYQ